MLTRQALRQDPLHETCAPLARAAGRALVAHLKRASGGYELLVLSPTGRTLLKGVLDRRVDTGLPIAHDGKVGA